MKKYNITDAKLNLEKIVDILQEKQEDYIVITKRNKPILKDSLFEDNDRSSLFGAAKNLFTIPDNFDVIDISSEFSL